MADPLRPPPERGSGTPEDEYTKPAALYGTPGPIAMVERAYRYGWQDGRESWEKPYGGDWWDRRRKQLLNPAGILRVDDPPPTLRELEDVLALHNVGTVADLNAYIGRLEELAQRPAPLPEAPATETWFAVYVKGEPFAAYPQEHQAEVYATNFKEAEIRPLRAAYAVDRSGSGAERREP